MKEGQTIQWPKEKIYKSENNDLLSTTQNIKDLATNENKKRRYLTYRERCVSSIIFFMS